MRPKLAGPPDDLASLPVHVVVRDFPEVLPVLQEAGVDVAARGADPLAEVGLDVVEAVARALAWRKQG